MSAAPQLQNGMKLKIQIQQGPLVGQKYSFQKTVISIGRGAENDLILSNDLRASRKHAELRWQGSELHIYKLSAKSFLLVDGREVESAKLDSGSVVLIGETEFIVEIQNSADENEMVEAKTKVHFGEPPVPVGIPAPVLQPTPRQSPLPTSIPSMPNYGTNLPGNVGKSTSRPRPRQPSSGSSSRARFYMIVAAVGLLFAWLMFSNNTKKKELTFRSTEQIEKDLEASRGELKEFEARKEKLDNIQYRRAQENYIRGFRDYKQGNYGRARESFQVVLNLDPENELAKRYYQLAKLKFDELVKFNMLQGNRYREKKNWRMCMSSYFNVMTMIGNNQDPVFKEARQYYQQCSLAQEGRY